MKDRLRLNKEIYKQEKIDETIKTFGKLAYIQLIVQEEHYYECIFSNCKYDVIRTVREFENYLIAISNREKT